jgi:HSP20 family protein
MNMVRRTSPWSELTSFRTAFDRLFDEGAFRPLAWSGYDRHLPLDVRSSEEAITVEAALPGVRPEDVEITVHQDNLTIAVRESAERESAEGERVYREVRRSRGSRTLTLPSGLDVDAATATFENGMLRLAIPRAEQAKPRQIAITPVTEASAPAVAASVEGEAGPASES